LLIQGDHRAHGGCLAALARFDLSSFFASCEQQEHPEPVIVVPTMAETTTCAIAASYPSKAFGINTGTLVVTSQVKNVLGSAVD